MHERMRARISIDYGFCECCQDIHPQTVMKLLCRAERRKLRSSVFLKELELIYLYIGVVDSRWSVKYFMQNVKHFVVICGV